MPRSCQVCAHEARYTCASCGLLSCSLPCYKQHRETSCHASAPSANVNNAPSGQPSREERLSDARPLRPLTSLKWPYAPEESAYPDPLKRDDPKLLQLHQYEAIATSSSVRAVLASHPSLKDLLISIDKLRGEERELALQKALGVTPADINAQTLPRELGEDTLALRQLAEAIEVAVRGENKSALGLDWGDASD